MNMTENMSREEDEMTDKSEQTQPKDIYDL